MSESQSPIEAALSQIPQCAQASASQGITESGCGFDFACLCTNPRFLTLLTTTIQRACSAEDQNAVLHAAKELCVTAVPSLNDSRQSEVTAAIIVMMVLALVAVGLRFFSRKISAMRFGIDDAFIIAALILTCGLNALTFLGMHYGYGLHMIRLSSDQITNFAKSDFATQIVFACSITAIKLSILFFYHRIFSARRFTIMLSIAGIITVGWCIALIFSVIFSCWPVHYFWDKTIDGHCINENSLSYGVTAANIVTDIAILALPIPWLWRLQMETTRKLAIICIFVLGCFVCIAAIIRIPLLTELKGYDATWTIVDAGIWINVECNIGIVSACLPVMRPLLNHFPPLPTRLTSSIHSWSKYFSFRSIRLSNPSSGGSSTRKKSDSALEEAGHYLTEIPNSSNPSKGATTTKVETYRSRAESYRYQPTEHNGRNQLTQKVLDNTNRSLWLDDEKEEVRQIQKPPRSIKPPASRSEYEYGYDGSMWRDSNAEDEVPIGVHRSVAGYRRINE